MNSTRCKRIASVRESLCELEILRDTTAKLALLSTNSVVTNSVVANMEPNTVCNSERVTPHLQSSEPRSPTFPQFTKLVPELRVRIYKFVLASDHAINPHLCDKTLKFHDDNQRRHGAINALLGVTRVSKQIRDESLPIFYSTNTFAVGKDTATYFDRLEHLGRFHMIRHVRFTIDMRKESSAAMIMRSMNQYIKEVDAYEAKLLGEQEAKRCSLESVRRSLNAAGVKTRAQAGFHSSTAATRTVDVDHVHASRIKAFSHMAPTTKEPGGLRDTESSSPAQQAATKRSVAAMVGESFPSLTNHPQYHAGGSPDLSVLIALRKLTSTFTGNATCSQKLVLPVPHAAIFTQYDSLKWFPTACYGLGIHLHLVESGPQDCLGDGYMTITWHQKFQKKDFTAASPDASASAMHNGQTEVYKRALELFPRLESMPRPHVDCYYRLGCNGELRAWYDVPTEGGGVLQ